MSALQRLFVSPGQISKHAIKITGSDVHYVKDVLRSQVGDPLDILDGLGKVYATQISKFHPQVIECTIISLRNIKSEPTVRVTIAQSLPKGSKMDGVIQKSVELGVVSIIPMMTERTIPQWSTEKGMSKVKRWQRIAKEAAEQSARLIIPTVQEVTSFPKVLSRAKEFDLAIFLWELEKERSLKQILKSKGPLQHMLVLIGPEGGFSVEEAKLAQEAGCVSTSLGRRILRAETVATTVLAMVEYEYD